MSGRISEHHPSPIIGVEERRAERQDLTSSLSEVGHVHVEVELLGIRGVRPSGAFETFDTLKCVDRPIVDMQRRK